MNKTTRGFDIGKFIDHYGSKCSIQKSSLAFLDCIWLGVDDANPEIMCSDAKKLGLPVIGDGTGWQPYELPEQVHMTTRMHLTRAQVATLLPTLQRFVDTGELT